MPYPDWRAGNRVTPARLNKMQQRVIQPTATQTVNNSATLVSDLELTMTLSANAQYIIELQGVFTSASTSSDLQVAWSVPAGATGTRLCVGPTASSGSFTDANDTRGQFVANPFTTATVYQQGTGTAQHFWEYAYVTTGTAGGALTIQWAQNTATAANTVRNVGSTLSAVRYA